MKGQIVFETLSKKPERRKGLKAGDELIFYLESKTMGLQNKDGIRGMFDFKGPGNLDDKLMVPASSREEAIELAQLIARTHSLGVCVVKENETVAQYRLVHFS